MSGGLGLGVSAGGLRLRAESGLEEVWAPTQEGRLKTYHKVVSPGSGPGPGQAGHRGPSLECADITG